LLTLEYKLYKNVAYHKIRTTNVLLFWFIIIFFL